MTVNDLRKRLSECPPYALAIGFVDTAGGVRRHGILVLWEDESRVHKEFIETPGIPARLTPAPPMKTDGGRKR
jgi:hypothetical protein